ncbi:hypothetical protein [Xanthocytophaga agilis]|uniref:Conjugative transposon TraJ C-terminal domain-containing protein n=1 Tax=Xanthocytophaga agilis TaxID=3048010 RepID=A0AAE3UGQ8_9BACT|nr:hypothetical protein [Xanthocytophaga agilis]MDJ1505228.1 hypothetical protein [Xanthocytophaga agilis]
MNNWGHINQAFLDLVLLLMNTVRQNCLFLVPAFLVASLIVAIMRAVFSSGPMVVNGDFMLRGIIIWCILFNYVELLDLISGGIEGFRNLIPQPASILEDLNQFSNRALAMKKDADNPNMSTGDKIAEYAKGIFDIQFGITYFIRSAIEEGITMVIRIALEKIRAMLLAFLTVAGPLSLAISVFPGMEKVASHWFRGWFSVHMWSVTLRILDAIIHNYNQAVFSTLWENDPWMVDSLIVNLVCMLMYLMVPTLTAYFIGQTLTGGFLSKLAGTASAVLGAASSMASFGAGAAKIGAGTAKGASAGGAMNLGTIGVPPSGGGGSPVLTGGATANQLNYGNSPAGLLGGGSPSPLPGGGGGFPPMLSGGNTAIPIRQKSPAPQPRINTYSQSNSKVEYTPYELV